MTENQIFTKKIKYYTDEIIKENQKKTFYFKEISKYLEELKNNNNNKFINDYLSKLLPEIELLNMNIQNNKLDTDIAYINYIYNSGLSLDKNIEFLYKNNNRTNIYEIQYKIQLYKLLFIENNKSDEYKSCLSLVKKYKELSLKVK